jgi:hypothetical protein
MPNAHQKQLSAEIKKLKSTDPKELYALIGKDRYAYMLITQPELARIRYHEHVLAAWVFIKRHGWKIDTYDSSVLLIPDGDNTRDLVAHYAVRNIQVARELVKDADIASQLDDLGRSVALLAANAHFEIAELLSENKKGAFDRLFERVPGLKEDIEKLMRLRDASRASRFSGLAGIAGFAEANAERYRAEGDEDAKRSAIRHFRILVDEAEQRIKELKRD